MNRFLKILGIIFIIIAALVLLAFFGLIAYESYPRDYSTNPPYDDNFSNIYKKCFVVILDYNSGDTHLPPGTSFIVDKIVGTSDFENGISYTIVIKTDSGIYDGTGMFKYLGDPTGTYTYVPRDQNQRFKPHYVKSCEE